MKQGKNGLFAPIATRLIDVSGGNASSISCSGSKTNAGAGNVSEILSTLKECEDKISTACDPSNYPHPENDTETVECYNNMLSYKTAIKDCVKKRGTEACDCFEDTYLVALSEKIRKCDIKKENKAVTDAHRNCTATFSTCKSTEDSAGKYVYTCKQTTEALKKKAGQAAANVNALTSAKSTVEALVNGTSSRMVLSRNRRDTGITSCAIVITTNTLLLQYAAQSVYSSLIFYLANQIAAYVGPACTSAEITVLAVQVNTYTTVIIIVTVAVVEFKATVAVATGEEPTDDEIAAAITTVAPSPTTLAPPVPAPVPSPLAAPVPSPVPTVVAGPTPPSPAPAPASVPATVPSPAPTPAAVPTPPSPAAAPAPAPVQAPAPVSISPVPPPPPSLLSPAPAPISVPAPVGAPVPAPVSVPAPAPESPVTIPMTGEAPINMGTEIPSTGEVPIEIGTEIPTQEKNLLTLEQNYHQQVKHLT